MEFKSSNHTETKKAPKKRYKILGFLIIACIAIGGIFLGSSYYEFRISTEKQLAKIDRQVKELPELEEDIFAKCMEERKGGAKNIAFCQENTQKQMHTLSQDLKNAKKDIISKEWYDTI